MASIKSISELSTHTAQYVTSDTDNWKSYLTTASRLYKYRFDEQLLIYAQRPDATACASMDIWNNKMNRWIKAGSKGIAVIRENEGGVPHLEHVFDISDTRPLRDAKTPYLWKMREEYKRVVLDDFYSRYGGSDGQDFGSYLMGLAHHAAVRNYSDYLRDLLYDVGDGFLKKDGQLETGARFLNLLVASVQYTLLIRCGLSVSDYLDDRKLEDIMNFSSPIALHHLGDAVSTVSMGILLEIGQVIRKHDREMAQNRQEERKEKVSLEKNENIVYTTGNDKFNTLKCENEGRNIADARTDIHENGGLSDTGSETGRGGNERDTAWEVRDAETKLSKGEPTRDIYVDAADRSFDTAPAGNREGGPGTGGQDGGQADEGKQRGREPERAGSDGLATGSQQFHDAGGGKRTSGNRLQIDINQKQAEEQRIMDPELASAFFVPEAQKPVIDRILSNGGGGRHSIERIVAFFQKSPSISEASDFLKDEYGTGGKGFVIAGQEYALWFDESGIRIAPGRTVDNIGCQVLPWPLVAAEIYECLEAGIYATQEKLDSARENEYRELAGDLLDLRRELSDDGERRGFLSCLFSLDGGYPKASEELADILKEKEGYGEILSELSRFVSAYEQEQDLLRYCIKSPVRLLSRLSDMRIIPEQYEAREGFEPLKGSFITEDEINHMLLRGGNVSESRIRIYSYFTKGHDAKECANFLKEEYGVGGIGSLGYDVWHDSKGLRFSRGDEGSDFKKYDTVYMKWNELQRRIIRLITTGKYLNPEEMARAAEYKKEAEVAGEPEQTVFIPADRIGGGIKESAEGQLAFDFDAMGAEVTETVSVIPGPAVQDSVNQQAGSQETEVKTDPVTAANAGEDIDEKFLDLDEAKHLIEAFCYEEYRVEEVDFSNPERIGIVCINTEDERHEIVVEVNLTEPAVSKFYDDICVEKREYGSLRELIDKELSALDFNELVSLDKTADTLEIQGGKNEDATDSNNASGVSYVPRNFRIVGDDLGTGGPETKYQNNITAIRTLKKIESERRLATPAEQEVLSQYVGWGSLSQVFDPENEKWAAEYVELKELLMPDEYDSTRSTVLNAFYTSPVIIREMYDAVCRMDFVPGSILEPSCAIGNFFGLVPEKMTDSRLFDYPDHFRKSR